MATICSKPRAKSFFFSDLFQSSSFKALGFSFLFITRKMALESNSFFRSFASMRKFRGSLTTDFHGSNDKSHILEFHSRKQWKAHFDSLKETDKLLVIDFTAEWCGPCKLMDPSVKEYAAKYTDVKFAKIDVDELVDVAAAFGVQTLPAFIMIKREKVVDKVVGARKEELQIKIEKHRI